jgi:hypothetical protein
LPMSAFERTSDCSQASHHVRKVPKTRHDGSVLVDARIPEAIANAAANARAPNAAVTLEAKRYLRGRSRSRTTSFARLSDRSPR